MKINGTNLTGDRDKGILPDLVVNGGSPKENWEVIKNIRSNAKVPQAAGTWEEIDDEVLRAYEQEAKLIEDLRGAGLTTNHDLGNLFSSYRFSSRMQDADVDMSGEVLGEEDRVDYKTKTIPVPVIHKEFRIGWRESANANTSQDNIAMATRSVTRILEKIAWGDMDFSVEGNVIEGMKDTGTSNDWGGSGDWATASNAYEETIHEINSMKDKGWGGPFNLYVDQDYMNDLMALKSNTTQNYVEIIENLDDVNAVRFSDNIQASNNAYLLSMSRRAVDLAISQWVTPVNWEMGPDGRVTQYQVFAVAVPRFKKDYQSRWGVSENSDISS